MAETSNDHTAFVGDLSPEVDDALLESTFKTYYPSVRHAKVMTDPATGHSRCFGFVRFASEAERDRSITEMSGVYLGSKQIRVSLATARKAPGGAPPFGSGGGTSQASTITGGGGAQAEGDQSKTNTTLFIGGLSSSVTEPELHAAFANCGEIVYVKIPPGKGCGFVQFARRDAAEYALELLNGHVLGGMAIRVTWGKSTRPPGAVGGYGGPGHHAPPAYPGHGGYGGYGGAYGDPYHGAYPSYGMPGYDPYMYMYGSYDQAQGYGYGGAHAHGGPGGAAAAASAAAAAAAGTSAQPVMYDPLAPVPVDKMNMAFMHRHVPYMTGAYVRMPVALPMNQMWLAGGVAGGVGVSGAGGAAAFPGPIPLRPALGAAAAKGQGALSTVAPQQQPTTTPHSQQPPLALPGSLASTPSGPPVGMMASPVQAVPMGMAMPVPVMPMAPGPGMPPHAMHPMWRPPPR